MFDKGTLPVFCTENEYAITSPAEATFERLAVLVNAMDGAEPK
jgi:hypothetical protein